MFGIKKKYVQYYEYLSNYIIIMGIVIKWHVNVGQTNSGYSISMEVFERLPYVC